MNKRLVFIFGLFLAACWAGPALAQNDHYPQYMQMGLVAYGNNQFDLAITYYEAALEDNENWWPAYVGIANCYYAKGKLNEALKNYGQALKMHPDNPWATYVGVANCFIKQGKLPEALRYYEAASKMQPDNPTLANYVKALRGRLGIYPTPTPGTSSSVPSRTAGTVAPSASTTQGP